jgi:serine/threonine-protein kinase
MARRRRIDDRMLLLAGEVIRGEHTYNVERIAGSGAYACVYLAVDELGRKVALKEFFPPAHPREAPVLKNLFERERYFLNLVGSHPLIPTFYEGFISEGQYYIAQEYIQGRSLDDLIRHNKKIEREWMIKWAIGLCEVLSFIHGLDIVHHDLKPANIRITPENHLKLLDFGAAAYIGNGKSVPSFIANTELFGTEGYLPPEVEETFVADARTDIFALGCILYEMVMGEAPAQQNISERHSYVTAPLMQRKDIDLPIVNLITTALSYNTGYRFGSAQEFADQLKKIAPAILFISQKSIDFGEVDSTEPVNKKFKIFNAGGEGILSGQVKSLCSWITVQVPTFKTQKRDVILVADPTKVSLRNETVRGQIEIVTQNVQGEHNQIISRADRWLLDCYIKVLAKPASIHAVETTENSVLSVRGVSGKTTSFRISKRPKLQP